MNLSIKIKKQDVNRVSNLLKKTPRKMYRELRVGFANIGQFMVNELRRSRHTPIAVTGQLRNRNKFTLISTARTLGVEVYATVPYARAVNYGLKPKEVFPPWKSQSFLLWVRLKFKGVVINPNTGVGRIDASSRDSDVRSIAFLVARAIYEKGTNRNTLKRNRHYWEKATTRNVNVQRFIPYTMNRQIAKVAADFNR